MIGLDRSGIQITFKAMLWESTFAKIRGEDERREIVAVHFLNDPNDMDDEINQTLTAKRRDQGETIPPLDVVWFYPMFSGQPLPPQKNEPGEEIVRTMLQMFISMQLLAQQRIGEPQKLLPPRAQRKRAIKWDMHNQRFITLITLRRKSVKKDDHEPEKIERTHRWVVRGHWRRQWYPSLKRHDWKYIYEHIKGPEDKPLIVTERRVFNFRR